MENLAKKGLKCIKFRGNFFPKVNFFPPGVGANFSNLFTSGGEVILRDKVL